jgi:hypothetical protein
VRRMRPLKHLAVLTYAVLVLALCGGCASISAFSANPRTVCAGDPVTVTWAAVGDVTIAAEPPMAEIGPKESFGSQRFVVDRDTRFTLKARRLLSCESTEADVVVAPPAREYGGVAVCSSAERAIALTVPLGERQVSSALKVSSVTNANARPVVIGKGAVRETIPPGGRSAAFDREPVAGTWTLRADLTPGEICEDALRALASRLSFRVGFGCGE